MKLAITEQWLRERAGGENGYAVSAGAEESLAGLATGAAVGGPGGPALKASIGATGHEWTSDLGVGALGVQTGGLATDPDDHGR